MTPFQIATLCFTLVAPLAAWVGGGPPERFGALVTLAWLAAGLAGPAGLMPEAVTGFDVSHAPVYETAVEAALLVAFLVLALKGNRWWPFAASAVMVLGVLVYLSLPFVPPMRGRAEISAHLGLALMLDLVLLAGVGERWLAGETAARGLTIWNPFGRHAPAP
ncbi:hypothetical protein [Brevundimonas sp.]|uniref:hypothetical protein n=1 Tax=Brevundimonas sp. TaxID=1871086 RepID=UPI002D6A5DED|nr:hypothetical protein [Brevundimonas sp.]HYC68523.1 hypothetical protein [Brevundimonas sp.]